MVWVGRDDNKQTGLWGATGALQVWTALMRKLPSAPLVLAQDGLDRHGSIRNRHAHGRKMSRRAQLPFMAGFVPAETDSCTWYELKSIISSGQ